MKHLFCIIQILIFQSLFSQKIINGNFENNSANGDQINLSNVDLNSKLPGVTAFGSYGDVDIITSGTYGGGGAQDKSWYIALTGGGTDIVALSLSSPLIKGKIYTLTFYDRKDAAHQTSPIVIGISNSNNSVGTIVYSCPEEPVLRTWTKRTCTFKAENNEQFITVQMQSGGISDWANIDNFFLGDGKCQEELTINTSSLSIHKGESITFTVSGGNVYTWSSSTELNVFNGSEITFHPLYNTIYNVNSKQTGCADISATIAVKVIETKKDTVIVKQFVPIDTIVQEVLTHKHVKFTKRKLNGRKYKVQESLDVTRGTIKLMVWDKNRVDGDVVSIYLNGELLEENLEVTKIKKEIEINLHSGRNVIVMFAINLGKVPPNTAAIGIKEYRHRFITLVSDLKYSGALEIIYNPDGFAAK